MPETLLAPYVDIFLLFTRAVVGSIFFYYGIPKIKNLNSTTEEMKEKGLKPAAFWAISIALLEIFGGAGLLIGIYVWVWAILFSIMMLGGIFIKIKNPKKNFGNWSYDLLILSITMLLLALGPGNYILL